VGAAVRRPRVWKGGGGATGARVPPRWPATAPVRRLSFFSSGTHCCDPCGKCVGGWRALLRQRFWLLRGVGTGSSQRCKRVVVVSMPAQCHPAWCEVWKW